MVFEKKPVDESKTIAIEAITRINTNTSRIRTLEQRLDSMGSRIESLEERMIDDVDALKKSFDIIHADVKDISESLAEIHAEILNINKNMSRTAKKAEVKELESLLELYNPIKSKFTTIDQVRRLIEESKKT